MTSSSPQDQPNVKAVQSPSSSVIQVTPPEGAKTRSIEQLKQWFPDYFDWIGCFKGEDELHLKPDAKPYIDAPRRCPIHLRDKIKSELDKMEELGIIRKIDKHTGALPWQLPQNEMVACLRICLDPQRLNQALKRCPHKIPTVEEITPKLSNTKYFTKLDAKARYWSMRLAPESQELTTFRTHFGRYCFQQLAFGLNVSQDLYQQHMDRIIKQCEGCIGISDDVTIYGLSEAEHDRRLSLFQGSQKRRCHAKFCKVYHKDKPNLILWQSVHREWSASRSSKGRRHFADADATECGWHQVVCWMDGWMNQAFSRLSTTHGHITDCKLLVCVLDPSCTSPTCGQSL